MRWSQGATEMLIDQVLWGGEIFAPPKHLIDEHLRGGGATW